MLVMRDEERGARGFKTRGTRDEGQEMKDKRRKTRGLRDETR
jgi:hypothetical protein